MRIGEGGGGRGVVADVAYASKRDSKSCSFSHMHMPTTLPRWTKDSGLACHTPEDPKAPRQS